MTVKDGKSHSRDLELPAEHPIGELAPWIAKAIDQEDSTGDRSSVKYVLTIEGSNEPLDPDRDLRSAGVVDGDILRLRVLTLPKELAATEAGKRFAGPGFVSESGAVFPLRSQNCLVGRVDRAAGIAESVLGVDLSALDEVESPSVSRRHAQILYRQNGYQLRDLTSTNGTWIAGRQLTPGDRAVLRHGDRVRFGEVQLIFVWDTQDSQHADRGAVT